MKDYDVVLLAAVLQGFLLLLRQSGIIPTKAYYSYAGKIKY